MFYILDRRNRRCCTVYAVIKSRWWKNKTKQNKTPCQISIDDSQVSPTSSFCLDGSWTHHSFLRLRLFAPTYGYKRLSIHYILNHGRYDRHMIMVVFRSSPEVIMVLFLHVGTNTLYLLGKPCSGQMGTALDRTVSQIRRPVLTVNQWSNVRDDRHLSLSSLWRSLSRRRPTRYKSRIYVAYAEVGWQNPLL